MNRIMKRFSTLAVMAVSLFAWGCDNLGEISQPELAPSPMVVTSTSGKRYTVATEDSPESGSVTAEIGRKGGMVTLGRHTLYVSQNAVSKPTKFTMSRDAGSALRVKLTAGQQTENDIGATGFNAPVYLVMSFQDASDVPADRSTITIVYYRPDGLVEEMKVEARVWGNYVGAQLPHFSLFGIAWP